jgi:hypothetical protein
MSKFLNYNGKYLKYKNKYLKLKAMFKIQQNGGSKDYVVGINYEGGKIIKHILSNPKCVAYANCQIAMDAPYHTIPRVADETIRSMGRSESQFKGYDEDKLRAKLKDIFTFIKDTYKDIRIVIQIARGRAAEATFNEVIKPVLDNMNITDVEFVNGYRSQNYYTTLKTTEFVFVNYGMFAELSDDIDVNVGEICNPVITYDINTYNHKDGFTYGEETHFDRDEKNILNHFGDIKKLKLFGINDDMAFITPDKYDKAHIVELVKKID